MEYRTVCVDDRYYDIHFFYTPGNFDYQDNYRLEGVYELADREYLHNYIEELDFQFIYDVKCNLEAIRLENNCKDYYHKEEI